MSFGEIINMYEKGALVIDPNFQRLYRWTDDKKMTLTANPQAFGKTDPNNIISCS